MSHFNPNQHFDVESWRDRQIAQRTKDALAARDAAFAEKHADTPLRELALYLARCARTLRHSPAPCEVDGGTFIANDNTYTSAKNYYAAKLNDSAIRLADGLSLDKSNALLLFRLRYGVAKFAKNCAFLIVSWSPTKTVDKSTLNTVIDSASKLSDEDYYTSGDNYNAKTKVTSVDGFWTDYQKALTSAKSVADILMLTAVSLWAFLRPVRAPAAVALHPFLRFAANQILEYGGTIYGL